MKKTFTILLAAGGWLAGPSAGWAQAPMLGAAGTYSMFTANGDFINSGPTTIRGGDIGTNKGVVTGFPPGIISGGAIHAQDISSNEADLTLQAAYVELTGRACGVSLSGAALGNNQTLGPNVYCLSGNQTLEGALTLDGGSNPDALFILKINGSLTTGSNSQVALINGALARNVYWQITAGLQVGVQAVFRGTALSNGPISLLNGAFLDGRGLTQTGNVTTATASATPLPVELTEFSARRQGEGAHLRWATASEKNSAYFAVERSADGRTFAHRGRVAAHGSTARPHAYEWADARPAPPGAPVLYYRLRQVDTDSTATYSPVRTVAVAAAAGLELAAYPSPSTRPGSLHLTTRRAGPATVRLTDAFGRVVHEQQLELATGSTTLALPEPRRLGPGVYFVLVQQGRERATVRLVRE